MEYGTFSPSELRECTVESPGTVAYRTEDTKCFNDSNWAEVEKWCADMLAEVDRLLAK